jgi:hypothetical protein
MNPQGKDKITQHFVTTLKRIVSRSHSPRAEYDDQIPRDVSKSCTQIPGIVASGAFPGQVLPNELGPLQTVVYKHDQPLSTTKTSMLSSTARAFRSAAPNAVRLMITPQPANIAESREILRIVQRFGEVVTYKNLKVKTTRPSAAADWYSLHPL